MGRIFPGAVDLHYIEEKSFGAKHLTLLLLDEPNWEGIDLGNEAMNNRAGDKGMDMNLSVPVAPSGSDESSNIDILVAAKGGGIIFFGRLFAYAMRFFFGVIVARSLGADGFGLYTLGITTSIMLATFSRLGLSEGLVHFLPSAIQKQDDSQVWRILQVGVVLPTLVALGLSALLFGLADTVAVNIFNEPAASSVLRWISIAIPFMAVGRIVMASMRGFKYMRYGVYADNIAFNIVRLALTVLLLSIGWGLSGALGAYVIAWTVTAGLSVFYLNRIFPLRRAISRTQSKVRQLLSFSAPICLTQVFGQLRGSFELLMLGMLSTMTAVGVYSAAVRIQAIGAMFLMAVEMVAKPIISELFHQGDADRLGQLYQTLTRWSLAFVLPYFITIILFAKPILAIFGEEFEAGSMVLIIISVGTLINAGTGICGAMIVMTGHSKLSFFNSLITLGISVILNLTLIPVWGLVGAAIAAAVSWAFVNILRLFEVTWLLKLWPYNREIIKPFVATGIAFIVGYFAKLFVSVDLSIFNLVFNVAILWMIYIGVTILLGLSAEDRMLLRRARRRFNVLLNWRSSS